MSIIGCGLHIRFQQIALLDTTTGEIVTRRLEHEKGEAQKSYAGLPERARLGIEATGCTQWFERLLVEAGQSAAQHDPQLRISGFPIPAAYSAALPKLRRFAMPGGPSAPLYSATQRSLMTDTGGPCTRNSRTG